MFHHSDFANMSVDRHELGKVYIRPRRHVFVHQLPSDFSDRLFPPHGPLTVKHLIDQQLPQISLHVIWFSDATIILITWPYCMADGLDFQAILHNWSIALTGKL